MQNWLRAYGRQWSYKLQRIAHEGCLALLSERYKASGVLFSMTAGCVRSVWKEMEKQTAKAKTYMKMLRNPPLLTQATIKRATTVIAVGTYAWDWGNNHRHHNFHGCCHVLFRRWGLDVN